MKASGREQQTKCSFDFQTWTIKSFVKAAAAEAFQSLGLKWADFTLKKIKLEWCEALWERVDLNTCFSSAEIMIGR